MMSPVHQPHEPFDDESEFDHDDTTTEWSANSDDSNDIPDESLAQMLNDAIGDDWETEDFESENDFYDELRDRYEDDDPI